MRAGPSRLELREGGPFRLLCLPYAGGSAGSFTRLAQQVKEDWTVVAVQPPTAGEHDKGPNLSELADFYADLLAADLTEPGIILGHGVGAAVAHRMAQRHAANWPPGLRLVLSAPPRPGPPACHLLGLDDQSLLSVARSHGIVPDSELPDELATRLLLPELRQDLAVLGPAGWSPEPVRPPVHLLGGRDDAAVPPALLAELADQLGARGTRWVRGNHLFVLEQPEETFAALRKIAQCDPPGPTATLRTLTGVAQTGDQNTAAGARVRP
ncbi:thioesterase II family protein [Streptomyces zagrosensis]|uniref:Surfactin synthase thioesterase subunit n=1 Tax=Streptomyces zagrosensis TaxID=1042984 RepID=A0A7W9UYR6_9ACTN|nr:alpha/beta fold hydrolase [Streptomyces zagrosensis]MBB5935039.1 surfactin synthase thioesterase subunit [Streptomyces zagrosensis]